jgi:hypothetical protein
MDSDVPDTPKTTDKDCPPPVLSDAPDRAMERRLRKHPDDLDAKADVGSDESMDASDPPAAAQPGQTDEPVPSSTFPE